MHTPFLHGFRSKLFSKSCYLFFYLRTDFLNSECIILIGHAARTLRIRFDLFGFDLFGFDLFGFDLYGFDFYGFHLFGFDLYGFD